MTDHLTHDAHQERQRTDSPTPKKDPPDAEPNPATVADDRDLPKPQDVVTDFHGRDLVVTGYVLPDDPDIDVAATLRNGQDGQDGLYRLYRDGDDLVIQYNKPGQMDVPRRYGSPNRSWTNQVRMEGWFA